MKKAAERTPLMLAAATGDIDAAAGLLCWAGYQNGQEGDKTALMYAAERDAVEIVRLLLPAEAGLATDFSSTALMYAAMAGSYGSAELLFPFEKKRVNKTQEAALVYAAYYGHDRICALLAPEESGLYNAFGEFALVYGIQMNFPSVCAVLLPYEGAMLTKDGRGISDVSDAFVAEGRNDEDRLEAARRHGEVYALIAAYYGV